MSLGFRPLAQELARSVYIVSTRQKMPHIPNPTTCKTYEEMCYSFNKFLRHPHFYYLDNHKIRVPNQLMDYVSLVNLLKHK